MQKRMKAQKNSNNLIDNCGSFALEHGNSIISNLDFSKEQRNKRRRNKFRNVKTLFFDFLLYCWSSLYGRRSLKFKERKLYLRSEVKSIGKCRQCQTILRIFLSLLHLFIFLLLFPPTKFVNGGCRDDESRNCEAICNPFANGIANTNELNSNCTIRALVLLPDNNKYIASLRRVLPILKVAVDKLHDSKLLPDYIHFEWMPHDDKCDAAYAVIQAMDGIVKKCAHVIFGPVCDYPLASVSRITKYMNSHGTPLISVGGSTYDFEMKKTNCTDEFYMLLRTGIVSFETISEMTIAVMKRNKWSHSIFFYERDGQEGVAGLHTCFLMMNSLGKQMRKENMTFSQYQLSSQSTNRTDEMRREIGNKHAVVIMCGDPESIRQIMLTAEELNMIDSGEYVFINVELFSRAQHLLSQPWYDKNDSSENNERARRAYTAMLTVTPKQPNDPEHAKLSSEIKSLAASKYNYSFQDNEPVSTFVTSFFDGVLLYAHALNESIRDDPTVLTRPLNGSDMVRRMWNRSFKGISGNVTIDGNGDRISDFSLLDMNPTNGRFEIVAYFSHNRLEYLPGKKIHWAGNRLEPPPDRPTCGYDGSLCPALPGYAILSIVLSIMIVILLVGFFFGYRYYKAEAEINSMSWKVSIDDVMCPNLSGHGTRGSFHSLVKYNSQVTLMSDDMGSIGGDRQIFIPVGVYRGCKVAIKAIDERNINLNRSLMLELKRMKDLQHDHLVKFYGACLNPMKSFILTEYCPKGSLQDILENEQFQLDWMFRLSLMHDIVRGMQFLHSSDIKSHGNLKSSNCVVDSRFVLKITDFGLHTLRKTKYNKENEVENVNSHSYWSKLFWTAPELLRMENNRPPEGTQKGDVYSFSIIVHEITTRQGPFYLGKMEKEKSPQEIIELVKGYAVLTRQPFRPALETSHTNAEINSLMTKCWSEDPAERPDFSALKATIRKFNKDNETGNIVDNLLKRMELYANNLEELVEERTQDYIEEKKKCEKLLYQLLPQSVAAQLISGQPVVAETFDQVTIYFSDIVGFTAISAESTPMQVVQFLNDLYTCFDSIVENFDVYKVETIGDAYMVVSGLPIRNGNQHAREIARLALALLEAVHNFQIHHRPNDRLKLRIGLHTGACVAGVVGLKMPRYCLFGDTVNTASRMESNGEALKIHISEKTKMALDEFGTFITTRRGLIPMKGKGEMLTYWLEGEMPKPITPNSMHKMLLSRRASLKQQPISHKLHKQQSELVNFAPPPYQQPNENGVNTIISLSNQTSPNLRAKRKISSSSPKLNGAGFSVGNNVASSGDYKTEDFNYLDLLKPNHSKHMLKQRDSFISAGIAADIYSSRSLRGGETHKDNWELANFRLPLSGALKNHNNNNKTPYTSLMQSNSNSNLSGILQPASSRLRLKQSPTISTLVTCSRGSDSIENASISSGNRIKFKMNHTGVQIEDIDQSTQKILNDDSRSKVETDELLAFQRVGHDVDEDVDEDHELNLNNHQTKHASGETSSIVQLLDNSNLDSPLKFCKNNSKTNSCNNSSCSNSIGQNYNNIVKANNVRNFKLLCKSTSNSLLDIDDSDVGSAGIDNSSNAVGKSAVTQPLLAKINS